jgi:hypothetical protein
MRLVRAPANHNPGPPTQHPAHLNSTRTDELKARPRRACIKTPRSTAATKRARCRMASKTGENCDQRDCRDPVVKRGTVPLTTREFPAAPAHAGECDGPTKLTTGNRRPGPNARSRGVTGYHRRTLLAAPNTPPRGKTHPPQGRATFNYTDKTKARKKAR